MDGKYEVILQAMIQEGAFMELFLLNRGVCQQWRP